MVCQIYFPENAQNAAINVLQSAGLSSLRRVGNQSGCKSIILKKLNGYRPN